MQNAACSYPCMLANDSAGISNYIRSEPAISTNDGTEKLSTRFSRNTTYLVLNVYFRLVKFSVCNNYSGSNSNTTAQNAVAKKDTALHLCSVKAN